MNASSRETPMHRTARGGPEIRACIETRAEVQRYLVQARKTVDSKLQRLGCPETAHALSIEWLEKLELDLPDLAGLAGPLFDPDAGTEQFNELWDSLESIEQDADRQPETATEYLQAVARHANAGKLAMFYWVHLHYPLHERFDELKASVRQLLGNRQLIRRRQAELIQQNAEASRNAVTVYSYDTMDLHGDCFGWTLLLYRAEGRLFAETHQWTSEGDAHDPSIKEVDSGMTIADALSAGEGDGIWEMDAADYRQAVERVFDFDAALGIDFLDVLYSEYDVDIGKIGRPDVLAAWKKHLEAKDTETAEELVAGRSGLTADAMFPDRDNRSTRSEFADPIASALDKIEIEPARASGMWGGVIQAKARGERAWAARVYAIYYAQLHLQLPTGRHYISRDGQSGEDFWIDFPE